jgi:diguanylate cyclase (GGDEF)-like protein/PAS domain S-box-containing protein
MKMVTCITNQVCVIEDLADTVMITDPSGVIQYVNHAFEEVTGYKKSEAIGKTPKILNSGRQTKSFYKRFWETLQQGNPYQDVFVNRRKDGAIFYEEKTITPLKDIQGNITNFVAVGKDITKRIREHERLARLAYYDSLTGLANRMLFYERLRRAMVHTTRNEKLIAVLFLDLDRFKLINDTHGHMAGDDLLRNVAVRLEACVRESDTVARLAGDEFLILLDGISNVENVLTVIQKVVSSFSEPFNINNHTKVIKASIGGTFYPFDNSNAETLVRQADIAMYHAKGKGGNRYHFYSLDMNNDEPVQLGMIDTLSASRRPGDKNAQHLGL